MKYEKFEDWFFEVESFSTRAERFFNDVEYCDDQYLILKQWLIAAFEAGKESNESN